MCFAWSSHPYPEYQNKRFCGPKISTEQSEGNDAYTKEANGGRGVDCHECKPCPDLCKSSGTGGLTEPGGAFNGGVELINGVCQQWSGRAYDAGGRKERYCGPEIALGDDKDAYTFGGIDCRACAPTTNKPFEFKATPSKPIIGFHGGYGTAIDKIGVVYGTNPQKNYAEDIQAADKAKKEAAAATFSKEKQTCVAAVNKLKNHGKIVRIIFSDVEPLSRPWSLRGVSCMT